MGKFNVYHSLLSTRYAIIRMGKQICFCEKKTKKMRSILFDMGLVIGQCSPKLVLVCGKM